MAAPINDEVALRIGLATKEFGTIAARDLLQLLIRIMGEPITPIKLDKLRARTLRHTGDQLFATIDEATFDKAFALLKGRGIQKLLHPKPEFDQTAHCDMQGSLRIACASNSGECIDGPFSTCLRYLIYQVSPDYIRLIDIREPSPSKGNREKTLLRANLLKDCALLYATSIGAAAAAKVIKVGLHPITLSREATAQAELQRLQEVLASDNPPPWLAKAMGKSSFAYKPHKEQAL